MIFAPPFRKDWIYAFTTLFSQRQSSMTDLNTKLDKEINELLRAIHEYRQTHREDADEGLLKDVMSYIKDARELIEPC